METTDSKPLSSATFCRPKNKSSVFQPKGATPIKTSNMAIFSSLNSTTAFISNPRRLEGNPSISSSEEAHESPFKKIRSDDLSVNLLAKIDSKFNGDQTRQDQVNSNSLNEQERASKRGSEQSVSPEQENTENHINVNQDQSENIKDIVVKTDAEEIVKEENKTEIERPLIIPGISMMPSKSRQQEIFKDKFAGLVKEFELCWKNQLEGLREIEKYYSSDEPFCFPVPDNVHDYLLQGLRKKLKVDYETYNLINKVQDAYETNREYRKQIKEYLQIKANPRVPEDGNQKKAEKTKVIVINGTSNLNIGNKKSLPELENIEKENGSQAHS